jgi:hypothetical protein
MPSSWYDRSSQGRGETELFSEAVCFDSGPSAVSLAMIDTVAYTADCPSESPSTNSTSLPRV